MTLLTHVAQLFVTLIRLIVRPRNVQRSSPQRAITGQRVTRSLIGVSARQFVFTLGIILGQSRKVVADTAQLMNGHFAVFGGSGSGKSRFMLGVLDQAILQGAGVTIVDVAGDTVEDAASHIFNRLVESGREDLLRRTHYFEPGNPKTSFRFDPFRPHDHDPVNQEFDHNIRIVTRHAIAERIGLLVQIKQGQVNFEQNARLQRVLTNVLVAVGTAVDRQGRHLPLSEALVLLMVEHERHNEVYELVEPYLDSIVREDFRRLRGMRRVEDRLRETESTINRLRALLSPVLRAVFGVTGEGATVDFRDLITRRQIALWNLKPQSGFSHDQKRSFAQLVIHIVLETMLSLPRDQRVPHVLIIEEAAEVINEEILWALGAMRKVGLSIWVIGQDLSSFRKEGHFDMAPKLLSQCNIVCFNQTWPEDTEILARRLFTDSLDFTPLIHEHDRPDGYDWHRVVEHSVNQSSGTNRGKSRSISEGVAVGEQQSETTSHSTSRTRSAGKTESESESRSSSVGESSGETKGTQFTLVRREDGSLDRISLPTQSASATHSEQHQVSDSVTRGVTEGLSEGATHGTSTQRGLSTTQSTTASISDSTGTSQQQGVSVSFKLVPLARHRVEKQATGGLQRTISDQLEEGRQMIASLKTREMIVKLQNQQAAIRLETLPMPDPFLSHETHLKVIAWTKQRIFELHPYNFVPDFRPEAEDRRLDEFLAVTGQQHTHAVDPRTNQHSTDDSNPLL